MYKNSLKLLICPFISKLFQVEFSRV